MNQISTLPKDADLIHVDTEPKRADWPYCRDQVRAVFNRPTKPLILWYKSTMPSPTKPRPEFSKELPGNKLLDDFRNELCLLPGFMRWDTTSCTDRSQRCKKATRAMIYTTGVSPRLSQRTTETKYCSHQKHLPYLQQQCGSTDGSGAVMTIPKRSQSRLCSSFVLTHHSKNSRCQDPDYTDITTINRNFKHQYALEQPTDQGRCFSHPVFGGTIRFQ
ncbi:hypothetical protein AC579_8859 [Pseudocercospora musae]|uniref:Uncharacterized protein n=1 Tax=Pseudocercospora musae TaxID=113226 RepID=A0A139IGZ9_9PEZI|nr:hypothetical protein AC579_8859 [Pseudocercospora musae]